jgi:hypothetical protein
VLTHLRLPCESYWVNQLAQEHLGSYFPQIHFPMLNYLRNHSALVQFKLVPDLGSVGDMMLVLQVCRMQEL